jgi:hypothetical protein
MTTKYIVYPTSNRLDVQGFFVAQLNPKDINKGNLRVGKDCIVNNICDEFTFRIKARLQEFSEVEEGTIRIDQKIRMAIGVDNGGEVTISAPEWIFELQKPLSEKIFGKQINLLRVRKATFTDMEINICRIPKFVMESIGISEGDKIMIEAADKRIEIRALELTGDMINNRKEKECDAVSKYYSENDKRRKALMKGNILDYDLPWIFLDRDARIKLDIKAYDPIMVYRSNGHAIKSQLHKTTLSLIAGIVGFIIGLDYLLPNINKGILALLMIFVFVTGLMLTIWLNLLSIRKKLK